LQKSLLALTKMSAATNASEPAVLVAVAVHKAIHVITIVVATVFLSFNLVSLYKGGRAFSINKPGTRIPYWQVGIAFGVLFHSLLFGSALFGDYRDKPMDCWYLMGLVPLVCKFI
jgi:hypothetical protein